MKITSQLPQEGPRTGDRVRLAGLLLRDRDRTSARGPAGQGEAPRLRRASLRRVPGTRRGSTLPADRCGSLGSASPERHHPVRTPTRRRLPQDPLQLPPPQRRRTGKERTRREWTGRRLERGFTQAAQLPTLPRQRGWHGLPRPGRDRTTMFGKDILHLSKREASQLIEERKRTEGVADVRRHDPLGQPGQRLPPMQSPLALPVPGTGAGGDPFRCPRRGQHHSRGTRHGHARTPIRRDPIEELNPSLLFERAWNAEHPRARRSLSSGVPREKKAKTTAEGLISAFFNAEDLARNVSPASSTWT